MKAWLCAGEWDEEQKGPCAEGLDWPVLDRVHIMGLLGKINDASIKLEILSHDGTPPRVSVVGAGQVHSHIPFDLSLEAC